MKKHHNQNKNQQTATNGGGGNGDVSQLIQARAYQRYLERGQTPGSELEDWLQAERDVRSLEEHRQTA